MSQWPCAVLLPCLILALHWWIRLSLRCTWTFEIACCAAARSLVWAFQRHSILVLQFPQRPPLLLLTAISCADGFFDAVWAVNWHSIPKDSSLLPLYLLATLQISWRCIATASWEHFTCQGWFSPPSSEQTSPLGGALKSNDLHGVRQDQFMLFAVDYLVLFCIVGVNFLWNGVCVFVVAETQLS